MANVIKYFKQKTKNYQLDENGFYILINEEYVEIPNTKYKLEDGQYIEDENGTYIFINEEYIEIPEDKYSPFVQYNFGVSDPKYINVSGDGDLQTFIDRVNNTKILFKNIAQNNDKDNLLSKWVITNDLITADMWPILYETSQITFQKKILTTEAGKVTLQFASPPPLGYTAKIFLIPMDTDPSTLSSELT